MKPLEFNGLTPESLIIRKIGQEFEAVFKFTHSNGKSELQFENVEDSIDLGHLMAATDLGISQYMRNGTEVQSLVLSITHQYLVEIEFEHLTVRS